MYQSRGKRSGEGSPHGWNGLLPVSGGQVRIMRPYHHQLYDFILTPDSSCSRRIRRARSSVQSLSTSALNHFSMVSTYRGVAGQPVDGREMSLYMPGSASRDQNTFTIRRVACVTGSGNIAACRDTAPITERAPSRLSWPREITRPARS